MSTSAGPDRLCRLSSELRIRVNRVVVEVSAPTRLRGVGQQDTVCRAGDKEESVAGAEPTGVPALADKRRKPPLVSLSAPSAWTMTIPAPGSMVTVMGVCGPHREISPLSGRERVRDRRWWSTRTSVATGRVEDVG